MLSGPRKGKTEQENKKAEPRKRKAAPRQALQVDQLLEAAETINAPVTSTKDNLTDFSSSEDSPVVLVAPVETDERQNAQTDQLLEAAETISAPVTSTVDVAMDSSPTDGSSVVPVASAETDPVSYQTIADAYRRYTTESLDRTQTLIGRLAGAGSLNKVFELQIEFAKQAYDGFVAESRKIRELHSQMARQRLKQWEGLVARMISPR